MISTILGDIRYAARAVCGRPAFAAVVVVTLALGIGVNVAILSLTDQVLLRRLPVPEPDRLVNLTDSGAKMVRMASLLPGVRPSLAGGSNTVFSYPMFRDLERAQEPFARLAAYAFFESSIGEEARLETGVLVSGSYFAVLGVQPALGRLLGPQDDRVDGQAESVVLSHAYWQSKFGGDPDVLGRTLIVKDVALTIVGVAARGFHGTAVSARPTVFVPITILLPDDNLHRDFQPFLIPNHDSRNQYWAHLFARLNPGVTREEATAAMNSVYRAILSEVEAPLLTNVNDDQQREAFRMRPLVLEPGARGQTSSEILSPARNSLELLLAVSGVVLLLCCANVAGLMQLRATGRSGEMAVRTSLGATSTRLASLLLAESLVLALPAAVLSVPVAWLALRGASGVPGISTAAPDVSLSAAAALVAVGVAVALTLAVGLLPVRRLISAELGKTLQAHGARQTAARGVARLRAALGTAQVALSMALLTMTFIFAQSVANIMRLDPEIRMDSVVMFSVPPPNGLATLGRSLPRLTEALSAIPGVSSVAWSARPLLSPEPMRVIPMSLEGMDTEPIPASSDFVSNDFFRMFDIDLRAGREFNDSDIGRGVIIVNQRFAERLSLAPEAIIGRSVMRGAFRSEIVGVVADVRSGKITSEIEPQTFWQASDGITWRGPTTFYVRGALPPEHLINAVRETVARFDTTIAITNARTMEQQLGENFATERFLASASTAFAILATMLAGFGLYGVLAYSVAQRSREIGLRFALGAPASRIRGMVLGQVARMAVIGVVLGTIAAWFLGRAARSLLFGVEAGDSLALAVAAAVVAVVTLGAAYIPASRASRVDPMTVIRYE